MQIPQIPNLIYLAIPFFILSIIIEVLIAAKGKQKLTKPKMP